MSKPRPGPYEERVPSVPSSRTRFQDWLHDFLTESGMSNVQCGDLFGVNDSLIGHYLRGTRAPTYTTLQKIRDATNVDLNKLFD
ncbi:MAG: helix-turn-helix domain-containing protein [Planctomycetota bacterium]